jgi:hypothetical protein
VWAIRSAGRSRIFKREHTTRRGCVSTRSRGFSRLSLAFPVPRVAVHDNIHIQSHSASSIRRNTVGSTLPTSSRCVTLTKLTLLAATGQTANLPFSCIAAAVLNYWRSRVIFRPTIASYTSLVLVYICTPPVERSQYICYLRREIQ